MEEVQLWGAKGGVLGAAWCYGEGGEAESDGEARSGSRGRSGCGRWGEDKVHVFPSWWLAPAWRSDRPERSAGAPRVNVSLR